MRGWQTLAAIWLALPAAAQDLASCAAIETDLDRLACYDRLAGREPVVEQAAGPGPWSVRIEKSEFKDTTDVYLSVETAEALSCGMFDRSPARLLLRCQENTTAALLITSCHVASGFGGYGRVEYRVDDQPSRTLNFEESTDNRALGLWSGGSAIPFIRQLSGGSQLLMRFTPFNESPVTARFDIRGLDQALAPLRAACNW